MKKHKNFSIKKIDVEEATRIVSENFKYYLPIVTAKVVCDVIVASFIGRNLYNLFKQLWRILKPLFDYGLEAFINGIKNSFNCIQQSVKELFNQCSTLHGIYEEVRSKNSITNVLQALDYIKKFIVCAKTGLCRRIKFELTKYYLEIRGLIRALCEKFNINFLNRFLNSHDEGHVNGRYQDEPLGYLYETSLEQLLHGTEQQLRITREIRESNQIRREERPTYTITIEPGCKEGHIIRLAQVGDRDPISIPADCLITIRSNPHPLYQRQGADLIYTKIISYSRSNDPVQIPLLNGQTATINPEGIIDNNTELSINGHGLPDPDNGGARGRLLVRFDTQSPTNRIHCNDVTITQTVRENLAGQFD